MEPIVLKLGTRRSLLAWAQSTWVAKETERLNPQVKVQLVGIETRGDRIQNVSLQKIEGKEFFVAELDEALSQGAVDFTVHSLKDLSLDRSEKFVTAAIPRRANPRDVVLFGPHALKRLQEGKKLILGTSSPRRLENIPAFLEKALPHHSSNSHGLPRVNFVEIRGNVNTRLSRVHEPESSATYLDGVVLAFAGMIRLWKDLPGREVLEKFLKNVKWMVLPLQESPAAPGQGALAIECRADDVRVKTLLNKLHDPKTEQEITQERSLLAEWGGGCHQRFGATSFSTLLLGNLFRVKGVKPDGNDIDELQWEMPQIQSSEKAPFTHSWEGGHWRTRQPASAAKNIPNLNHPALFIAHSRAVPKEWAQFQKFEQLRIWTSGTSSWFKLAEMGIWVEGCAEGLGFEFLTPTLSEPVLQLPNLHDWAALTHDQALQEWKSLGMEALGTYQIDLNYEEAARQSLRTASDVFWSSGSQLNALKEDYPKKARHACGPGKTASHLIEMGLKPIVFPNKEEWKKWLKLNLIPNSI